MKMQKYSIILSCLFLALLTQACKKDDPSLTTQQEVARRLNGTWSDTQVISSPVAGATGSLESLVLTFTIAENLQPSTFSVSGAPDYFPAGGTWTWTDPKQAVAIVLDGELPVTMLELIELTDTKLTLAFTFNGVSNGRIQGIGDYRISLTKQQ